jgi:hypothetical protein
MMVMLLFSDMVTTFGFCVSNSSLQHLWSVIVKRFFISLFYLLSHTAWAIYIILFSFACKCLGKSSALKAKGIWAEFPQHKLHI